MAIRTAFRPWPRRLQQGTDRMGTPSVPSEITQSSTHRHGGRTMAKKAAKKKTAKKKSARTPAKTTGKTASAGRAKPTTKRSAKRRPPQAKPAKPEPEALEAAIVTPAVQEPDPAQERGPEAELIPSEEVADLAKVMEEIQAGAPEQAEAPASETSLPEEQEAVEPEPEAVPPARAPVEEEIPFEESIEPESLLPGRVEFVHSADEVLFDRAIEHLGMGDARQLRRGIEMLGHVESDTAARVLINLYRIAPVKWRAEIVHPLVAHSSVSITEFFAHVLQAKDEPAGVRIAALRGLYARDKAVAADWLIEALSDENEEVRTTAATYLGWLREPRALPGLERLIGDESRQVARAALHAASAIRK